MASPAISERVELAKLCSSRDWSKAIRVLDSLLSQSFSIQDICNRAFCYSQLELHKHVIKDCDKALQLDPTLLQAYILKGHAFSALGRKEDALLVWEQGYEYARCQSADLKQLLELEELLTVAKQNRSISCENHDMESSGTASEAGPVISRKSNETCNNHNKLSGASELCSELSDTSEFPSESNDTFGIHNESSDKVKMNRRFDGQPNGSYNGQPNGTYNGQSNGTSFGQPNGTYSSQSNGTNDILNKSGDESELSRELSDTCNKPSVICRELSNVSEICSKLSDQSDVSNESSGEAKKNKKFCVTRISKTKSISVDFRLSRGIAQVNEGKYDRAISIFDQILNEDPTYPEALIGRGTAYAFQRELDAAIADFTRAIQSNPSAVEAWKRRGQARAALGESDQAIADLTKALEFEPNSEDVLHERGIVNFKFKDFHAAIEDLSASIKLDKDNKSAYTYLGLALSSIGEYRRAEEAHKKSIQLDPNFLEAWAHLTQLYHDLANSEQAVECINQVLQIDGRYAKSYYLRGLLLHGMGEHRNAIKDLSVGLSLENSNIECLYLRASCHHAIGEYREAVKDYDAALDLELDSMEKFVLQCLAFYQKEIALYTASKINSEFCWFDIDGDINPLFKEYWCKRLHPKNVCEKVYRQPTLRDSLKKGNKLRKQDFAVTKQKTALTRAADSIGKKIQYSCLGFLPSRRQHRMAGFAAIEIAQKVSKAWRSLQYSNKNTSKYGKNARRKEKINIPSQNRGGSGCCTSSSLETSTSYGITEDRSSGRHMKSWHDLYSLAVKWRQISEPCDPVVWVNKLSEEFNSGFGSHTPLILGQAKVVRYFPNFQRTLDVAKAVIKEKMHVFNKEDNVIDLSEDGKLQDIMKAESCSDLYRVVGEDFWLATWCDSTVFEGRHLEGTRITLVKMGEHGFDFAIRTPCTPSRWEGFDAEMAGAWEALCNAYCGETYGSSDFSLLENVRDAILRMTYYWYNFMPLSRGSAAVGFVVLLGLLLAANMEFTGSIPEGFQVDWEAILNSDPNSFVDSVKSWLYPSLKVTTSWKDYPDVASTFETTGSVVAALSTYSD
ncbi:suppressor of RPS4-RLD 1-like isoform X1 [Camellia sinensis]|uniref:suppressor of RPS4-RLD 1-like isoform X1 n=1 Tax=Camellia sinensis TaxID=4442 RepID=UPI001036D8BA|nr:suppressor of RPS4-RLD 1-like isoform X1 [Camellia sinensis]